MMWAGVVDCVLLRIENVHPTYHMRPVQPISVGKLLPSQSYTVFDAATYVCMVYQWDQFFVRTAFEVSISFAKVDIDVYFAANWSHLDRKGNAKDCRAQ